MQPLDSLKPRRDESPSPPPEPIPLPWLQTPVRLGAFATVLLFLVGIGVMLLRDPAQSGNDPALFWPDTMQKLASLAGMTAVLLIACGISGWLFGLIVRRILAATREASSQRRHRARMVIYFGFASYTLSALVYYYALWQDFSDLAMILMVPYAPSTNLLTAAALGMGLGWLAATYGPPPFSFHEADDAASPDNPPSQDESP